MTALRLIGATVRGAARPRLDAVDLDLEPGELVVLIGPNGAGKSTLLGALAGLVPLERGEIRAADTPLRALGLARRAQVVAWLPQSARAEEGLLAVEVVAAARFRHREPWRASLTRARAALDAAGAGAWADRPMTALSGGEAQRVRLAALAAQEASWWLLDEPANHLDPAVRLDLYDAVAARQRAGGSAVLVTHDLAALPHLPPARCVGLRDGRVALDARTTDPDLGARAGALLGLEVRGVAVGSATRWVVVGRASSPSDRPRRAPTAALDDPPSVPVLRPAGPALGAPSPMAAPLAEGAQPAPAPGSPVPSRAAGAAAVVALTVAALAAAPWIGPSLGGDVGGFVLTELRLPRAALGAVVGATLGLTGAAFQSVLENPLATPSTIGTTAGASLGALAVLVLWPAAAVGAPGVALGAFVGAVTVSLGIASLATLRRFRTEELLLAGIAVSLGAGAAITGLQLQADAAATLASVRWSLGSLSVVGYDKVLAVLPLAVIGALVVLGTGRALQGMAGGADHARTIGVDVARTRALVLGAGSLAVAGCVAVAGPIAFVGLVVPHLVRLAVGGSPRRLLWLSLVAGAGFLAFADGLARVAWPGRELPVGVLTASLGAPTLLALLWRRRAP